MINNSINPSSGKSGNRCGHQPDVPRYFAPPTEHAERPKILVSAVEAIKKFYAAPDKIFPALNAANGSDRQQRSERREAEAALLQCILHYTDLVTLRVGIPQADGSMMGLTMPYLAEKSGLGERRTERAIADLKKAGLIKVFPVCKKISEAAYKGAAAIRTLSELVFTVLGLGGWLKKERKRASQRRQQKNQSRQQKQQANLQMAIDAGKPKKGKPGANQPRSNEMKSMSDIAKESLAAVKDLLKPGSG